MKSLPSSGSRPVLPNRTFAPRPSNLEGLVAKERRRMKTWNSLRKKRQAILKKMTRLSVELDDLAYFSSTAPGTCIN